METRKNNQQEAWLQGALKELDASIHPLELGVETRLRAARIDAMQPQVKKPSAWWHTPNRYALSMVLAIAVGYSIWPYQNPLPTLEPSTLNTNPIQISSARHIKKQPITADLLPIINAEESLEFYENIDFLLWLEKQG